MIIHVTVFPKMFISRLCACAKSAADVNARLVSVVGGKQQEQETPLDFQTKDSDPLKVSDRDLGKVYVTAQQTFNQMFSHGLQTPFLDEVRSCGQAGILVRKPALEIINQLKSQNPSNSLPQKFIINGPNGCGKTLTLAHVIHYCYQAKWLLVHIPSVFQWVYSKHKTQHSPHNPQTFDQPHEAVAWLKNFKTVNRPYLANLKTTCNYTWGKSGVTKSGSLLEKIIDQGLQKPTYATDTIGVLLKELANRTHYKILFAVDEFNGLFGSTSVQDPDKQTVEIQSLNLIRHFRKFLSCLVGPDLSS
jgi:small subunit ribosomal protein S29